MSEHTAGWSVAAQVDDIPLRGARRVVHQGQPIALFRTRDDAVFALVDRCPHAGGPLSEGIVHDGCVTCPLHNWVIALDSGEAQGADEGRVRRYAVRLEGRRVLLQLNTTERPAAADCPAVETAAC